jgi:hypothetical protein
VLYKKRKTWSRNQVYLCCKISGSGGIVLTKLVRVIKSGVVKELVGWSLAAKLTVRSMVKNNAERNAEHHNQQPIGKGKF